MHEQLFGVTLRMLRTRKALSTFHHITITVGTQGTPAVMHKFPELN